MNNLEKRFYTHSEKSPDLSSLVVFGHVVQHQRHARGYIGKHFLKLVDRGDYDIKDLEDIIEHMFGLSHLPKPKSTA